MKIESISIGGREGRNALEDLLSNEKLAIKKVYIVPTEGDHVAYAFYEEAEEQLNREKEELGKLDRVAIELEKDKAYKDLKNQTQRELYLLQKHNIPSSQAKKVIELLNMRKILQQEERA